MADSAALSRPDRRLAGTMTARRIRCCGDSNTHGTVALRAASDRCRHDADLRRPEVMVLGRRRSRGSRCRPEWSPAARRAPGAALAAPVLRASP